MDRNKTRSMKHEVIGKYLHVFTDDDGVFLQIDIREIACIDDIGIILKGGFYISLHNHLARRLLLDEVRTHHESLYKKAE